MTTTPAPTEIDFNPACNCRRCGKCDQALGELTAAREELAKTRAELAGRVAWLYRNSTRMTQMRYDAATAAGYDFTQYTAVMEQPVDRDALIAYLREEIAFAEREIAAIEASPATTAEPAALPLLPDIAHMATPLPDEDEDVPPMAVGIIPSCARCDAPMFVGHQCEADPADEPKATCGAEHTAVIYPIKQPTTVVCTAHEGKRHVNAFTGFSWPDAAHAAS